MALKMNKTEHAGAKRGRGAYWGPKRDAKRENNKGHRAQDARECNRSDGEMAPNNTLQPTGLSVSILQREEQNTGHRGRWLSLVVRRFVGRSALFTLDQVVPWGRSFDEYRRMFALTEDELNLRLLGCGDGPASFNAEATGRGTRVVSCDPIYRFDTDAIRSRVEITREDILAETKRNASEFVWTSIGSVDELEKVRMAAMEEFLKDFQAGKDSGRYVDAELPDLPFLEGSFDLALCSHLLFLYSAQLSLEFHKEAVLEMCRVASEVRIFPLLALGGKRSRYVDPLADCLCKRGWTVSVEQVPYEFQRGGDQMMRIRKCGGNA